MLYERAFVLVNIVTVVLILAAGLTIQTVILVLGRVLRRIKGRYHVLITDEGPEIHTALPQFEGKTPEGQVVHSIEFAGRELVVLLVSPECSPCHALLRAVEPVRRSRVEPPSFLIVVEDSGDRKSVV